MYKRSAEPEIGPHAAGASLHLEMDFSKYDPHMDHVNFSVNETLEDIKAQNVKFTDSTEQHEYAVANEYDSSFNMGNMNDAELGDFFRRPIRSQNDIEWKKTTINSELPAFNPWTEYFSDPRVLEKIKNFNLLRCRLKVKFIVNGNQFHFGRLMVSYIPLHTLDQLTVQDPASITDDELVQASQRPHLYIDPLKSAGGIMDIPYFWHNNFMSVPNEDWKQMGHLQFYLMNPLKMANGANIPVRITMLIWAEDVALAIPTNTDPGTYSPQSGRVPKGKPSRHQGNKSTMPAKGKGASDEYGKGPVSKPASYVAAIAGKLKDIPVIGPYARATEMAAGATAGIASVFGYSRPVRPDSASFVSPKFLGNLANANVQDNSTKLALDVKQELTVDSRTMCLSGEDEMTVNSIASRESYITKFAWPVTANAEQHLFTHDITPVTWRGDGDAGIHLPACAFAALPFEYWTGTINFRFQIVASSLHKGRLKLVYDPVVNLADTRYNTAYTRIVDISEERDFTVSVGWANERPFLRMLNPSADDRPYPGIFDSPPWEYANGRLSVYVVNELVSMTGVAADSDVEINVFISAGDDFKVASPTSDAIEYLSVHNPLNAEPQGGRFLKYSPQSGEEHAVHPDEDHTSEENAPVQEEIAEEIAGPVTDLILHSIAGESIASFRTCLKRYNFHMSWPSRTFDTGHDAVYMRIRNSNFPIYAGWSPTGIGLAERPGWWGGGNRYYNLSRNTLLNYLAPAYCGWRGGIRWKYVSSAYDTHGYMNVVRRPETRTSRVRRTFQNKLNHDAAAAYQRSRNEFYHQTMAWDGMEATPTHRNPVVEIEIPFYSNKRFFCPKYVQIEGNDTQFDFTRQSRYHDCYLRYTQPNTREISVFTYVSTGEDFNLVFFTGAPTFWFASPPGHAAAVRFDDQGD